MESPPFPVPARGWRLDESGITSPRGLIPWSEVAEVTQAEDGDDVTHVQAVLRTTTTHRVVSGVVALMLEATPAPTCRDVAYVLIGSTQKNDPLNPDWITNAAGRQFHRDFGFGRVDATARGAAGFGSTGR